MDCLSGFASSIARDLVCGAVDELRHPCCFDDLVGELQSEQDILGRTIDNVHRRIVQNEKQNIVTDEVVHKWLEGADKAKGNVEELLKNARTKKSCCFGQFPNWIWRYRVGRQLAKKKTTIVGCKQEGSNYTRLEHPASPLGFGHFSWEKCMMFKTRQSAYDRLMQALKDDEVNIIGLFGMGGCGKTTLATEVWKKAKEDKLFDQVLFVTVSSTVDVPKIQDAIASSLNFKLEGDEEMLRAQLLCQRLSREEKVLVILDNVWQVLDLKAIGIPSREIHKRCKVLIITRSLNFCSGMDCQTMIPLQDLDNEEAWALFQQQAHISDDLKHLARQISDCCKGLPVAIAAVAGTLKCKGEEQWKVALDRLKKSKPVPIEKGLKDPNKCLRLSYDNLDMEEAKSLFLLCSVFPEEFKIPVEDLTQSAIGLGLIGEVYSYEVARNEVCNAKTKLVNSCLLLDANERKCVKMHDLVRQVAHFFAKEEGKGIKCALKEDVTKECTSLRYLWCEKFPDQLYCPNLEFLCIDTYEEVLGEIFKGMKNLRVLFLVNKGYRRSPLSMESFKSLTNLHCLHLQHWDLGDISLLEDLKNLESLTLRECSFLGLPDDVVIQLPKLRLLDLSNCDMERTPFEVIGRHSQLEELYIDDYRKEWDVYDETTAGFFSKFSVPPKLQRYHIQLGTKFIGAEEEFLNYHKTLFLSCFDTSNAAVKDLAKNAEVLLIANIEGGAKNIIPGIFQLDESVMNELFGLLISDSNDIEHLVDTGKLRKRGIYRMKRLRSLCHGQPLDFLFKKLENLSITNCPKLTSLFTLAVARNLVQLEVLDISYCDELKQILVDDNKEEISTDAHRLVFPKLKQLTISDCDKLEYIIPITHARGLLQLKCLEIRFARELKYVFGQCKYEGQLGNHQSQNKLKLELPLLEKLTLDDLPNVINMCPENCYLECPSLVQFTLEDCLEDAIMSINTCLFGSKETQCDHNVTEIGKNWSLKKVHAIKNRELVGKFKLGGLSIDEEQDPLTIFLEKVSYTCNSLVQFLNLQNLEQMKVSGGREFSTDENLLVFDLIFNQLEDSTKITSIPSAPVNYNSGPFILCNLKKLILRSCGKLRTLFSPSMAIRLTSLESLTIEECHELRYLVTYGSAHENKEEIVHHDSHNDFSIFPRLERIVVKNCNSLEYIFHVSYAQGLVELKDIEIWETPLRYVFGHSIHDDDAHSSHQCQNKIQIELPILERVVLFRIPNMINICPDNYYVTCLSLRWIVMDDVGLSTLSNNNLVVHLDHSSTLEIEAASMTSGQLLGHVSIWNNSKIKGIFHMDKLYINGQQVTSWLIDLSLVNLPELNHIWEGAKHSVTFQNLKLLYISGCGKLKIVFSSSVSRSLPQLKVLAVIQCEGLEQIIEDDDEHQSVSNYQSQKICFLNLKLLLVTHCDNLKRLFYLSTSLEFPELEYLILNQNPHLEQLFEGVQERKVEVLLPKLEDVILMQLPNLSNVNQCIEFQNVNNLFMHNCPKLSPTSTTTVEDMLRVVYYHDDVVDFLVRRDLLYISKIMKEETAKNDCMLRTTSHLDISLEDQSSSGSEPHSLHDIDSDQSTGSVYDYEHNQIESGATESHEVLNRETLDSPSLELKSSSHHLTEGIKETETTTTEKVPAPVKTSVLTYDLGLTRESTTSLLTTLHKISSQKLVDQQTTGESSFLHQRHELGKTIVTYEVAQISIIPPHDGKNIQEGSTSEDATKVALSASTEGNNDFGGVVVTHTEPNGGEMLAQYSQLVKQGDKQNEDEIGTTPCQKIKNVDDNIQEGLNLMDKEGEIGVVSNDIIEVPSASTDTNGSHSLIIGELGAYKHFVDMDDTRIALLAEAIAMYPHLWNVCAKFSKRFQAFMLQTLADILLFVRNESAVSITPQREKEFHKLCDEAVQLGFERSWVDRMRKRVTVKDPKVEQLNELLKRQDQLTLELLKIKDEINNSFNAFVGAQNKCFDIL